MIALSFGDRDGRLLRDRRTRPLVRREPHPLTGLGALVDTELEGAAPSDAAEHRREVVVVLELEPVHEAVLAIALVHAFEQRGAREAAQRLWPEARTEVGVVRVQIAPARAAVIALEGDECILDGQSVFGDDQGCIR